MKLDAAKRLQVTADNVYDENLINNDKDYTWQHKQEEDQKNKIQPIGEKTPKDTYTQSPGDIANTLKNKSKDYGQASRKLNNYINRQGRNLQGGDKARVNQAKDALRQSYGEPAPKPKTPKPAPTTPTTPTTPTPSQTTTTEASPDFIPRWHSGDQPVLETGLNDTENAMKINAKARLIETASDKWSSEVTEHDNKSAVPDGTFKGSADEIAHTLKRVSDSHKQAAERLSFYKNRGGSNLSPEEKSKLDSAQEKLKSLYGT